MDLRADILALLTDMGGRRPDDAEQADIIGRFGMDGDDITEFLDAYSRRFNVRLDGLLWYFHHFDEPPLSRRVYAVGPDGHDLPLMPITVDMLVEGVETGKWPLTYPEHREQNRWWSTQWALLAMVFAVAILLGAAVVFFGCAGPCGGSLVLP
ncbi:MAG: DUF1493 family protein [Gemmobacter sp.]